MKNNSPHRSFKGSTLVKASFRPFYKRPWPEELPTEWPACSTEFRTNWNLYVGPNRIGRFFKRAAHYSFFPCLFGAFAVPLLFESIVNRFTGGNPEVLSLVLLATPPLLAFFSLLMPIRSHLECKKCGWSHDYKTRKPSEQKA